MARNAFISMDGYSTVQQGGGEVVKSRGSQSVRCDLDQRVSWWGLHPQMHVEPPPLDKNGQPMLFCNHNHFAPASDFGMRCGKKDHICLKCRKLQRIQHALSGGIKQIVRTR